MWKRLTFQQKSNLIADRRERILGLGEKPQGAALYVVWHCYLLLDLGREWVVPHDKNRYQLEYVQDCKKGGLKWRWPPSWWQYIIAEKTIWIKENKLTYEVWETGTHSVGLSVNNIVTFCTAHIQHHCKKGHTKALICCEAGAGPRRWLKIYTLFPFEIISCNC